MANPEPINVISSAIKNFKNMPMREAALGFFSALGYRSERALELKPNNAKQFRVQFDPNTNLNEKSALLDEWLSVDLLFQLTDAEIQEVIKGQGQLFTAQKIHNTDIRSYLLFSVYLKGREYSRAQLAGITREINKLPRRKRTGYRLAKTA